MGKTYVELTGPLIELISQQHVFFVATAPLEAGGRVNVSPKGLDSFRILGPKEVAYLDLTGSGVETIAHVRQNGRLTILFCTLEGPPKIVRLYGRGEVLEAGTPAFDALAPRFASLPGARAIIRLAIEQVSDSCGYGVPEYEFRGEREVLPAWAARKSDEELVEYRRTKNARSIDGLPGID